MKRVKVPYEKAEAAFTWLLERQIKPHEGRISVEQGLKSFQEFSMGNHVVFEGSGLQISKSDWMLFKLTFG